MQRALVTGATGLLGYHVCRRLREVGCEVHALVRNPDAARWLQSEGATLAGGDVRDAASVDRAAANAEVIFHCAAVITTSGGWSQYRENNVLGTQNVLAAARQHGARIVHASSVADYGSRSRHRRDGNKVSEDTPFAVLAPHENYPRSKRESEELILNAHRSGVVWACALRPDVMYGVRDRQFIPRAARLVSAPIVPVIGAGTAHLPVVHAGNVADAMVLAATSDSAGGRAFNVANDFDITYLDLIELAAKGLGRNPRIAHVPVSIARVGARTLELLARTPLAARFPLPASNSIDFVTKDNPFTSERARRELGWSPRHHPAQEVPASFRWWLENRQSRSR